MHLVVFGRVRLQQTRTYLGIEVDLLKGSKLEQKLVMKMGLATFSTFEFTTYKVARRRGAVRNYKVA